MATLPKKANIVLDHRYYLGNFRDYSGQGNHGTPTGVNWVKRPDKHIKFDSTDVITVADAAELQLTQGTLIAYGDFADCITGGGDQIVGKRDAGGTDYAFYLANTTQLGFYDGSNIRVATVAYQQAKSLAVSFNSGETAKAYKNGAFITNFSGTSVVTVDDAPLLIGNLYTLNKSLASPLKGVLIYNTILTAAEIAQTHAWIMEQKSIKEPKRNFNYSGINDPTGATLLGHFEISNTHGKCVDKTDNANHVTISGATPQAQAIGKLPALDFTQSLGAQNNVGYTATGTISLLVKRDATLGSPYLYDNRNTTGGAGYAYMSTNTITVDSGTVYTNGVANTTLPLNQWVHVVIAGQTLTDNNLFTIGARFSQTFWPFAKPFNGKIADFRVYNGTLTQAQISALYNQYAKLLTFQDNLKDANESIAAEGGAVGNYLSNTNWKFGDATARYKISRASINGTSNKVIECTTAGVLYQENRQWGGTYEFDYYKGGDANIFIFLTHASVIGSYSATGQNGYGFYDLNTEQLCMGAPVNGSGATPATTAVAYVTPQTWYHIKITRNYDGKWYMYLNGALWTLSSGSWPITNATYGSSYMCMDLDAGDKIANFKFYNGVF